jgi:hypothetical protein
MKVKADTQRDNSMNYETTFGIILTLAALSAVVILTLWCRSIIDRIHARSLSSLREIQQKIINGSRK